MPTRSRFLLAVFLWLLVPNTVALTEDAPFAKTEDTTLLCHFDGPTLEADFAAGNPVGRSPEPPKFLEGRFGKAVSLSGKGIEFDAAAGAIKNAGDKSHPAVNEIDLNHRKVITKPAAAGAARKPLAVPTEMRSLRKKIAIGHAATNGGSL